MANDKKHTMLRDANVVVRELQDHTGSHAVITVNDAFEHVFPADSRVSKHLDLQTAEELAATMTGGSYFFLDDELIDFRDSRYGKGFVHTDASLDSLMHFIGYTDVSKEHKSRHRMMNRTSSSNTSLSKVWDKQNLIIPHYQEGGDFDSQLSFMWNPFEKHIGTKYDLVRLICTNGMVGLTPFINMKVPLVNRWQEHIEIANRQLQNKISTTMVNRISQMANGRASVQDALLLDKHIMNRVGESSPYDRERLMRIQKIVDPYEHLAQSYKAEVFENTNIAEQLPSHLSVFDAWNIATEIASHTAQTDNSSDRGLQKLANSLMFDRECTINRVTHIGKHIEASPFSSPSRAFFGDVEVVH